MEGWGTTWLDGGVFAWPQPYLGFSSQYCKTKQKPKPKQKPRRAWHHLRAGHWVLWVPGTLCRLRDSSVIWAGTQRCCLQRPRKLHCWKLSRWHHWNQNPSSSFICFYFPHSDLCITASSRGEGSLVHALGVLRESWLVSIWLVGTQVSVSWGNYNHLKEDRGTRGRLHGKDAEEQCPSWSSWGTGSSHPRVGMGNGRSICWMGTILFGGIYDRR